MVCHQRPCIIAHLKSWAEPTPCKIPALHLATLVLLFHHAFILQDGCLPVVATMKLDPIHRACAKHHSACPNDCGCRVILMTPVSHRCSLGLSTAATCSEQHFTDAISTAFPAQTQFARGIERYCCMAPLP